MLLFIAVNYTMGFSSVLIAHITFNLPFVILSVAPRLGSMNTSAFEAAQDLGASKAYAFWKVIFPANGWGCQCYTESLSERDLKRMGKTGPDPTPELNYRDVVIGQRSPGGPRTVSLADIGHFAEFTGDTFYAHTDPEAAAANPLTPEEAWAKAQELDAQAELDEANGVAPAGAAGLTLRRCRAGKTPANPPAPADSRHRRGPAT